MIHTVLLHNRLCSVVLGLLLKLSSHGIAPPKIFFTSAQWLKHKEICLFLYVYDHTWETALEGGREGWDIRGPPKVRDEMHWHAQVIGLHTFGVLQSHRHPVVIHQHMCWNVSPSLNIVSVGVQLMHDCFSLVHAEGHCWLVLQYANLCLWEPWCHAYIHQY